VRREPDGTLRASVRARAHEGKANEAVVRIVAAFLRLPRSQVRLVSGMRGRLKTLEVPDQGPGFPLSIFSG
jgi:hypothetical protein